MNLFNFMLALAAIALVISPSVAEVKTVAHCDVLPPITADWDHYHTLPLFDPSLGELIRVDLTVELEFIQNFSFENKGPAAQKFESNSSVELIIATPDSGSISITAFRSMSEVLPEFDGDVDFSGPSGRTIEGLTVNNTKMEQYINPYDFVAAVPGETLSLPASTRVEGRSRVPGNSVFIDTALAGSKLCVVYTYEPIAEIDGGRSE